MKDDDKPECVDEELDEDRNGEHEGVISTVNDRWKGRGGGRGYYCEGCYL